MNLRWRLRSILCYIYSESNLKFGVLFVSVSTLRLIFYYNCLSVVQTEFLLSIMVQQFKVCVRLQEDKPNLLLPWLLVGAVKNLGMGMLATATGLYTCAVLGGFKPICLDFLLSQFINIAPSVYIWIVVLR